MSDVHFVFMEPHGKSLYEQWNKYITELLPPEAQARMSVVASTLQKLEPSHSDFDCIVSPANSYGIMDGGFDYYLSAAFSPERDIMALTRAVQASIKQRYYGFAPPGTCTLVALPPKLQNNRFPRCRVLAVCPTMRSPADVSWHKDIVYNTMWTLLTELEQWNTRVPQEQRIDKVVMTGLATGVGGLPKKLCAWQMVLAIKHFLDVRSAEGQRKWTDVNYPDWKDVLPLATAVDGSHLPSD